jgi:hypothetical protein
VKLSITIPVCCRYLQASPVPLHIPWAPSISSLWCLQAVVDASGPAPILVGVWQHRNRLVLSVRRHVQHHQGHAHVHQGQGRQATVLPQWQVCIASDSCLYLYSTGMLPCRGSSMSRRSTSLHCSMPSSAGAGRLYSRACTTIALA